MGQTLMNFMLMHPKVKRKKLRRYMRNKDILKAEYLLPIYIDELLQAGKVSVKVLDTNDKWFGVTYKEDKDYVVKSFARLIEDGVYQKNLFEDLK